MSSCQGLQHMWGMAIFQSGTVKIVSSLYHCYVALVKTVPVSPQVGSNEAQRLTTRIYRGGYLSRM